MPWRNGRFVVGLLVVALVGGACGATELARSLVPASSPALPSAVPTDALGSPAASSPSAEPTASLEPSPSLPAIVDRSLLAVLPDDVATSPVQEDVDGEREFGAGPGETVRRYAAAVVGDAGENIAAASLAVVDPADMAAFFPAWRGDYDAAACDPTGGVDDTSLTEIGGREVEMTTCVSGVRLYHLRLRGDSLVVSISSIGPADFGAQLIEGLRE